MNKGSAKVLLVEDEVSLGTIVKESLESRGFNVEYCQNGEEALSAFTKDNFHILVLDIMMPKVDGLSLLKTIRKKDQYIPVIFLTAKSRTEDVIEGFKYGANDYIKKPFSMEELIVRMNALIHKPTQPKQEWLAIGAYYFHHEKQLLKFNEEEQFLTNKEAELLMRLLEKKNELTDRSIILNALWGSDDFFNARSMDVYISKLRKKLSQDPSVKILNIRGYGYKLVV
ncbi:DNA-binding response regulator [Marivirga lumbricoides]|uniref:DNA-binding response regulator n=1 Tax=Marivirga lumbricoides TaxID=1046115 RepID=A0ABQ1MBW3_9BACT|nr:DNA-binding response regulator [Marivirga lumbricoides]